MIRLIRLILLLPVYFAGALAVAWAAGALFFDLPAPKPVRVIAAAVWLIAFVGVWLFARPRLVARLGLIVGFALLAGWWLSIKPRQDRAWRPEVAVLARAQISGDNVSIDKVRDFDYRTETDFTPRYDARAYDLSHLTGIDLFVDYWGSPWIAHPIISFDFGTQGHLCFSVETRPEQGETYSAIGGLYRQFELIYIPADERDVVRVRTNYRRGEDVYLYRLKTSPAEARERFLEYCHSLNALAEQPRWYNAITSNCTTSIRTQHAAAQRAAWDWRILLNGKADKMLFERGAFVTDALSFTELKKRAHINPAAKAADQSPDFSSRIRAGIPGFSDNHP